MCGHCLKADDFFVVVVLFFETRFLCSFGACPGTRPGDQAGLEFTEIVQSVPPEFWD